MRQRNRTGDAIQVLLLYLGKAEMDYFSVNCAAEMWRLLGCFSASPWREEQDIQVLWMLGRAGEDGSSRGEDIKGGVEHMELAGHGQHGGGAHPASLPMKDGCLRADLSR